MAYGLNHVQCSLTLLFFHLATMHLKFFHVFLGFYVIFINKQFIYSPIEKHLGCLYMLAVMNETAIKFMSIIFCGYVFSLIGEK